ncbi:hypothetical protein BN14_08125 [Rhizoctonia solani AG-1 IB]|uniref:Uncharacterized protein n=1 Tax=Thanatephorus cucumeris (strain AG1-IB / isolate 7/3/14) TaxID=1108050 RepID=M5C246_THACB|nr:hypothetical protein BN14_08125 [Rhizoctonia solani AG-1 IB]
MPIYQSNAELSFNHCMDVNFYVQNSPEAMKDNLSSAANFIHILLNASNRRNVRAWRVPKRSMAFASIAGGTSWPAHLLHSRTLRSGIAKAFYLRPLWCLLLYQLKNCMQLSPTSNTFSNSDESLATPPAETSVLPSFQSANSPTPPQGLWQLPPSPPADIW